MFYEMQKVFMNLCLCLSLAGNRLSDWVAGALRKSRASFFEGNAKLRLLFCLKEDLSSSTAATGHYLRRQVCHPGMLQLLSLLC